MVVLMSKYDFAQKTPTAALSQPRYPLFIVYWFVTLFLLTYVLTWVYVSARATLGPEPHHRTARGVCSMGFVAWHSPLACRWPPGRLFSRGIRAWGGCSTIWVGSILATLVSAWLYKKEELSADSVARTCSIGPPGSFTVKYGESQSGALTSRSGWRDSSGSRRPQRRRSALHT